MVHFFLCRSFSVRAVERNQVEATILQVKFQTSSSGDQKPAIEDGSSLKQKEQTFEEVDEPKDTRRLAV